MTALFTNNASSRLPNALDSAATSLLVWAGDGAKFPSPAAGDWFAVTIEDRRTGQIEICKCLSRSGDQLLQLQRGQEGTTAQSFALGATVSNRMTAGAVQAIYDYSYSKTQSDQHFVDVTGDTMTGQLSLPLVPAVPASATSKDYVDKQIALIGGVAEPPNDGQNYARHYQGWTVTITKATYDAFVSSQNAKDATQDSNIATNATNVANNTANIANNTANIASNTTNIANNTSDILAIQGVNGNQDVSIANLQANKVNKAGDTMTGPLVLSGAPTAGGQATNKTYVDAQVASVPPFPEAPIDGNQYARQSASWQKVAVVGTTSTGDKPPTSLLKSGQMWFESDTGGLFIYYDDGNSQQWVQINTAVRSVGGDVPSGTIVDYAGSTAPQGWMMCYGQLLSRVLYPALFAAIGTTYGAGDGSTTFNAPDCRGRVAAGKDDMGGTSANRIATIFNGDLLGITGGIEAVTLDMTMVPAHNHNGVTGTNSVDHSHSFNINTGGASADHSHYLSANTGGRSYDHTHQVLGGGGTTSNDGWFSTNAPANSKNMGTSGESGDHIHGIGASTGGMSAGHVHNAAGSTAGQSTSHTHTVANQGGGLAHSNMQPTIVFNKIIKV